MNRPAVLLIILACAFRAERLRAAAPDALDLQAAVASLQPGAVLELPPVCTACPPPDGGSRACAVSPSRPWRHAHRGQP